MTESDERLAALKSDAAKVMDELGLLTRRLAEVGKMKASELGGETVSDLAAQLEMIKGRMAALAGDSRQTIGDLDKSVRTNPYIYILCALGLGMLLGKARRP